MILEKIVRVFIALLLVSDARISCLVHVLIPRAGARSAIAQYLSTVRYGRAPVSHV